MTYIDCKSLPLSHEFKEILVEFTLKALKKEPDNLYEFAMNYFRTLLKFHLSEVQKTSSLDTNLETWLEKNLSSADNMDDVEIDPRKSSRRLAISAESWNPHDIILQQSKDVIQASEKSEIEREILKRLISRITIFKSLCDEEIEEVVTAMNSLQVKKDDVIIQQGDPGDHFYVIQSGIYDVFIKNEYEGLDHVSTYNNQGSFGELSLLYNSNRSATIIARTNGILWYMNRKTFKSIVIMKAHIKRLKNVNFISSVPLFSTLSNDEKINIAEAIQMKTFERDAVIITQGESGEHMYFIESGRVAVYVTANNVKKQIAILEKGQYFGELSLMTSQPRAATVICLERSVIGMLERSSFERLLGPCLEILQRNAMSYQQVFKDSFDDNLKYNKKL